MFHKIKRGISFFVLVGLISVIPAFANPEKAGTAQQSESFVINLQDGRNIVAETRFVNGIISHTYRLNLKPGETVSFKLNSGSRTSLKVKSPSGIVKQTVNERSHHGVLSGVGEFVFEVSSQESSVYRLEVRRN
jgi:hypothetical protein